MPIVQLNSVDGTEDGFTASSSSFISDSTNVTTGGVRVAWWRFAPGIAGSADAASLKLTKTSTAVASNVEFRCAAVDDAEKITSREQLLAIPTTNAVALLTYPSGGAGAIVYADMAGPIAEVMGRPGFGPSSHILVIATGGNNTAVTTGAREHPTESYWPLLGISYTATDRRYKAAPAAVIQIQAAAAGRKGVVSLAAAVTALRVVTTAARQKRARSVAAPTAVQLRAPSALMAGARKVSAAATVVRLRTTTAIRRTAVAATPPTVVRLASSGAISRALQVAAPVTVVLLRVATATRRRAFAAATTKLQLRAAATERTSRVLSAAISRLRLTTTPPIPYTRRVAAEVRALLVGTGLAGGVRRALTRVTAAFRAQPPTATGVRRAVVAAPTSTVALSVTALGIKLEDTSGYRDLTATAVVLPGRAAAKVEACRVTARIVP